MARPRFAILLGLLTFGVIHAAETPRPHAITAVAGSSSLLIPAAGNVEGGNGTHFRTEITLVNHDEVVVRVALRWITRDVTSTAQAVLLELPAKTVLFYDDFVGQILGQTGLGSILIRSVDAAGEPLPTASLDAFARIWTFQPGTDGTVSQPMYALRENELLTNASRPAYILGMKQTERFRANLGVVNLNPTTAQSYTVHVAGTEQATSFRVDLAPFSMKQVPLPAGNFGDFYLVIVPIGGILNPFGESTFAAYGSTVDNVTGDAWSVASTFGFDNP